MWLERFPLGERVSFSCQHLGLEYPGEVVRADTWSPRWGHRLTGEVYFRVVLLRQLRGGLEPVIQDPRIAVCLPAAGLYRRRSRLSTEISTTRKTQAVYLAQKDTEAELIRQTLRRRLEELEEQLLGEDSVRYSDGQVITGNALEVQPESIFAGMDPNAWFSRLADCLLTQAYPKLPVDLDGLPVPIGPEAAGNAFSAFFEQPNVPSDVIEQLVPSLGLTGLASQEGSKPVAGLIRQRISQGNGAISWAGLHRYLAHEIGLTGPLATTFLLAYLHSDSPNYAIELHPDHQIALLDGRPLLTELITPDLIPALRWDPRLSEWAVRIIDVDPTGEQTGWNDALHHLAVLSPRLTFADTEDAIRAQERVLLDDLSAWNQALVQARQLAESSNWAADDGLEILETQEALERLSAVQGPDFRAVYDSIRGVYKDFRRWESDLDVLRELAGLAQSSEEISGALEFLRAAAVPPDLPPELSVDRQALLASLSIGSLAESLRRNLEVLMREVAGFKMRYLDAYRAHHENLRNQLPVYKRDLELAQLKLRALELLNTLPELGEPTGNGLEASMDELGPGPTQCSVDGLDISVDSSPWCAACRLTLDYQLPMDRLARLTAAVDMDLGSKNRQLSTLLVERILQGKQDERLDDLLKIVQASDLSALSNTINVEFVGFIQGIIS